MAPEQRYCTCAPRLCVRSMLAAECSLCTGTGHGGQCPAPGKRCKVCNLTGEGPTEGQRGALGRAALSAGQAFGALEHVSSEARLVPRAGLQAAAADARRAVLWLQARIMAAVQPQASDEPCGCGKWVPLWKGSRLTCARCRIDVAALHDIEEGDADQLGRYDGDPFPRGAAQPCGCGVWSPMVVDGRLRCRNCGRAVALIGDVAALREGAEP